MTPAARISAAIDVLDRWFSGAPVEQVLTNWGRMNRYAGSGDRRAIRDLVYDALRRRRSYGWLGGADSGRGLMLGALRAAGTDPAPLFTGRDHAPPPLDNETGLPLDDAPEAVRLDCPDWLFEEFARSGFDGRAVLNCFQRRAPVFLRVNLAKITRDDAIGILAGQGISARLHPLAATVLEVTDGARSVAASDAYRDGLIELQDAASQAVVDALGVTPGLRALDFCAGGGGKALALAAQGASVTAHDANPGRMRDIAPRAARAGVRIDVLKALPKGLWPLVVVDAPCSGTGTWSRDPETKWRLTPERMDQICDLQAEIINQAAKNVAAGGRLAWITCSLLPRENAEIVSDFIKRNNGFQLEANRSLTPLDGGDGFSVSILKRNDSLM